MTNDRLAKGFVTELLAYALVNRGTFEIVKMYLKYSYLQKEAEKKLVQFLFRYLLVLPFYPILLLLYIQDIKELSYIYLFGV